MSQLFCIDISGVEVQPEPMGRGYEAWVEGDRTRWARGDTADEAVGGLIRRLAAEHEGANWRREQQQKDESFLRVDISEVEAQLIEQQIGYHCPHCKSSGFLQEDDGRCSFCSGRENGECIHCGEICTGDTCTVCGQPQTRGER